MNIGKLGEVLVELGIEPSNFPHGSNLLTKIKTKLTPAREESLLAATPIYLLLHHKFLEYERGELTLRHLLSETENYYDLIKTKEINKFSHQSDFISSLVPELLCVILRKILNERKEFQHLRVVAQKDIVIECNFDTSNGGRLIEKRKRMDIAILSPGQLRFNETTIDMYIPAFCAEVKTNIDKNMLSGIESSVETLKRTFPKAKYFAISEFSDFDLKSQNYASTGIDEIFIIRHQKRSDVRKSSVSRNPLSEGLISDLSFEIDAHLLSETALKLNLQTRMSKGKLT
jgi:hypothetical protein